MCKNAVFILHFCSSRGAVSPRKEKPRKPLEEYGGSRKKTFLCPTTGDATCATLLRRCHCSKIACAFGAAAPAAIFAGV